MSNRQNWSQPIAPLEAAHRAGGRRKINASRHHLKRQRQAEFLRRYVKVSQSEGIHRGMFARIAREMGCVRSALSNYRRELSSLIESIDECLEQNIPVRVYCQGGVVGIRFTYTAPDDTLSKQLDERFRELMSELTDI